MSVWAGTVEGQVSGTEPNGTSEMKGQLSMSAVITGINMYFVEIELERLHAFSLLSAEPMHHTRKINVFTGFQ